MKGTDQCPEHCMKGSMSRELLPEGFSLEREIGREAIEVELVLILTELMSCFGSDDLLPSPSNPDAHCRNLFFSVFLPCKTHVKKPGKSG
jgi:nicotinamidase-related amidase